MSSQQNDIIVQNIINCNLDIQTSQKEIALLLGYLFDDAEISFDNIIDFKNDIYYKYELLNTAREKNQLLLSSKQLCVQEQLEICECLLKKMPGAFISSFDMRKYSTVRIAYWYSNIYSNEAYRCFEKLFESCTPIPAESLNEVCDSIDDSFTFGILPITNSSDGRLMSFYRMMDKYDLKISAVCRIENQGGDGFTKFALVGKQLFDNSLSDTKTIEILSRRSISEIIIAAEQIGGRICEITSIPLPYSDESYLNYVSVSVKRESIIKLWMFLQIFFNDVEIIGVYAEL